MANILRYVDPDSTAGGDGTTNALTGTNRAYVSLNAWIAAQAQNLTDGGGDTAECICDSNGESHTVDTTMAQINGFTTAAANYVYVHTPDASPLSGKYDATRYRLEVANSDALRITDDHVRVSGLQVAVTAANSDLQCSINIYATAAGSDIRISKSIIKQCANNSYNIPCIHINNATANVKIWDTIGYGLGTKVSSDNSCVYIEADATADIYNCTFLSGYKAVYRNAGTVTAKNVYAGTAGAGGAFNGTIGKTNCASSDATADGTNPITNVAINTTNFTNVTAGSEDFRLPGTGSALYHTGADPGGADPLNYTTDINGDTFGWSIGADEYVTADATPIESLPTDNVGTGLDDATGGQFNLLPSFGDNLEL